MRSMESFEEVGADALSPTGFRLLPGSPAKIWTFRDVFYLPGFTCLFDRDGRRIDESAVARGLELTFHRKSPAKVTPPTQFERISRAIYLGFIPPHWGHVLTEGISRLWALRDNEPVATWLYHGGALLGQAKDILQHGGVDVSRLSCAPGALLLDEVLVPDPSFVIRSHLYRTHEDLPLAASRSIGADLVVPSSQPVYFSRRRLAANQRGVEQEEILESLLQAAGVRIVYPEQLALDEQVKIVNAHETFICCAGSAHHSLLFRLPGRSASAVVLTTPAVNTNLRMIDRLKAIDSRYIVCLTHGELKGNVARDVLDLERARAGLKDAGIL